MLHLKFYNRLPEFEWFMYATLLDLNLKYYYTLLMPSFNHLYMASFVFKKIQKQDDYEIINTSDIF